MSFYSGAQRSSNDIVIYLSPRQKAPEAPPFELQPFISRETWETRIPTIVRVASRYSKVTLERIWVLLAFLGIVVAPLIVYPILANTVDKNLNDNGFDDSFDNGFDDNTGDFEKKLWEARGISFGIFFGMGLFFWTPMIIWKSIGHKQMNTLLRNWEKQDRSTLGPNAPLPIWKVQTPGVFNSSITLTLTIPAAPAPSNFHPGAYLPSFINGPKDGDMQSNGFSNLGGVPLYNENNQRVDRPEEQGAAPAPANPFLDASDAKEKNPFTDATGKV